MKGTPSKTNLVLKKDQQHILSIDWNFHLRLVAFSLVMIIITNLISKTSHYLQIDFDKKIIKTAA